LNYRHHFHAGNFADLVKHATLLAVLERRLRRPEPLLTIDTHAGAGGYDLSGEGESAAAVRLRDAADAPPVFAPLTAALEGGAGEGLFYPGSPLLIAQRMRPGDRLIACELRPDDREALNDRLGGREGVEVLQEDGYATAAARLKRARDALVLVDPPYERADEYDRVLELLGRGLAAAPDTTFLVWLPLKELETFDRFLRGVEALPSISGLVGEVRLRPLTNPMRLNGCAVLVVGETGVEAELQQACEWTARTFGEPGGEGRAWRL
jgi:23S rRNA (adenine2030-N6)-methyltransferase